MTLEYMDIVKQEKQIKLVKDVLGEDYINLQINNFNIKQSIINNECEISCKIHLNSINEKYKKNIEILSIGKGPIDSLFSGFINVLENEFITLKDIKLCKFYIKTKLDETSKYGTNGHIIIEILVTNSNKQLLRFKCESNSIISAIVHSIIKIFQHYINAEYSVILLKKLYNDAKNRYRTDLMDEYTSLLSEIVKNTNYSDII
jgi:hypothetical protein